MKLPSLRCLLQTNLGRFSSWGLSIVVIGSALSACSPVYLLRAVYEEGKILWRREPIAEYLQSPQIDKRTQDKLRLVLAVREYARDELKMNVGGSYSSYSYVDRPELSYILMAAPKTELKPYTWWFLIVGRVPYKGYFSKEAAGEAAAQLDSEGYDTYIRSTAAFSTLGWFDDPLLAHLLAYDKVTLAEVVFHELFHNTLYIKGASAFNESLANFVGGRAAIDFFRDQYGDSSAEHGRALAAWSEELEFSDFLEALAASLTRLYGKDISLEEKLRQREIIFTRAKEEWAARISAAPSHRFRAFVTQPLNNAVVIHYLLYMRDLRLFQSLYEARGKNLSRTLSSIRAAVERGGEPFEAVRTQLRIG